MPKGPKGERRPADVIGNAIKVARIATGEEEDIKTDDGKDAAAAILGHCYSTVSDQRLADAFFAILDRRMKLSNSGTAKRYAPGRFR